MRRYRALRAARALIEALCALLLSGCAGLWQSPAERADAQARAGQFQPVSSVAGPIKAWLRVAPGAAADAPLTIYIEGDGANWRGPYRPPADPTPDNALTLRLALRDPLEFVDDRVGVLLDDDDRARRELGRARRVGRLHRADGASVVQVDDVARRARKRDRQGADPCFTR